MEQGLRYSLFLKEGRALPRHTPLYSSTYVYRRLKGCGQGDLKISLSPPKAQALVATYRRLHPDTVWVYDVENKNQLWLFWKEGLEWILICVQDPHQTFEGGRIGWVTACFAKEPIRKEPFEALVNSAPYSWIWMDRAWLPEGSTEWNPQATTTEGSTEWSLDGPFHWYAYQWSTNLRIQRFYGIVV